MKTKPNFFVVGFRRSGTTALYSYLSQHPQIFMTTPKEPRFFCTDLTDECKRFRETLPKSRRNCGMRYIRYDTIDKYMGLFHGVRGERAVGEASTAYSFSEVASRNIKEFNPEAKIIIMVREPVEFLYSHYCHLVQNLEENILDFEEALNAERDRKEGRRIPRRNIMRPSLLYYREYSKYVKKMSRYFEQFPAEQICVTIYDDFRADNRKAVSRIFSFLGVDADFPLDLNTINPNLNPRFKLLRWIMESGTATRALQSVVPRTMYNSMAGLYGRIVFRKGKRPPLDPKVRKRLMKEHLEEVENLSSFLNRDLVRLWGYDKL